VDMPKRCMVCRVDDCRKGKAQPKLSLKCQDGLARNMFYIQILIGILFFGVKVDHKLVKDRSPAGSINKLVHASPVSLALRIKKHTGHSPLIPAPPVGNVAKVALELWPLSEVF
jgi:hypothetical protein